MTDEALERRDARVRVERPQRRRRDGPAWHVPGVVTATDGTLAASQAVTVVADAFRIAATDTTPRRGQRLTVTATTAEDLDTLPRLRVTSRASPPGA